ncbi:hypothetical protein llap_14259 [Limosa lapponica baueri]|uniref:RING-type E3 ubiquitin transferase n=1 Tax=Limosa lapponica baueri TaxID=1758121 RepID=A0A2I0TNP7_LIMLA|nr:hypothetical protein llap_14259 [Limosa lapponica baueri]
MATEWSCPICCDTEDGIAYVSPCHHLFCLGCIMRWAKNSSICPLCKGPMEEVKFSLRGESDYLQCVVRSSKESPEDSSRAGRGPNLLVNSSPDHPATSSPQEAVFQEEQGAVGTEARASVGDAMPDIWAELFQDHRDLLNPVLPWLRRELRAVFGRQWWLAKGAETLILQALCLYGLDEEAVVQWAQSALGQYTATLVHDLINVIMRWQGVEEQVDSGSQTLDFSGKQTLTPNSSSGGCSCPAHGSSSQQPLK